MRLASQAASGAKWTSLSTAVNTAAEMLKMVVLARLLLPTDFGLMAMVTVVIGIAQTYIDLGISAALIHRQDASKEDLSSLYWLNIFAGLAAFVVLWICTPLVTIVFREPRLSPLLHATLIVFLVTPVGAQFQILLQRELAFKVLAWQEILSGIVGLVVGIFCAVKGMAAWSLVYSFLASSLVKTGLLMYVGFARFCPMFHFSWSDVHKYTKFGVFQLAERTLNYMSSRADQVLIGHILGAESLGYYNLAYNLATKPIYSINPVLTRVAFPLFAKVQHDTERLKNGYLRLVGFLAMINAPLLIGLAVIAPVAVPTVFGPRWVGSTALIQLLCFVGLLRSTMNPIGSLQLAKGRADLGFWWNVASFSMYIPTIYVAGRVGGIIGIAEALLALHLVQHFLLYRFMVRPLIGPCAFAYAKVQLVPALLACSMGAVVAFASKFYKLAHIGEMAVSVALGACVYATLVVIFDNRRFQELKSLVMTT